MQFGRLTREATQSSGVSCVEPSSESVAALVSLKSPACSTPISPVEPHMISKDHPICAAGDRVHRSSAETRKEEHERIVSTTPSINTRLTRLSISSLKCSERFPWRLWRSYNKQRHSTPLPASVTRSTVARIIHDGSSRKPVRTGWLLRSVWFISFVWLKKANSMN